MPVSMIMLVIMAMMMIPAVVIVTMAVTVSGIVVMMMVVRMEGGLGEGIVLVERLVVAMAVAAAVGPHVGFEGRLPLFCANTAQAVQHVGQDRVVFQLQIPFADFKQHVAVAQVIRGSGQLPRRGRKDMQHVFLSGFYRDETAVLRNDYIAVAQYGAPLNGQADRFAVV